MSGRAGGASAALLLAGCSVAGLAACGFHLEGHAPLPSALKSTYVQTRDEQSDFVLGLRRVLEYSGAELTEDRARATAVVDVLQDQVTQRVLAVSPSGEISGTQVPGITQGVPAGNTPIEYEITYTVRFSVTEGDHEVLPAQEVVLTRDYSFDEHQLLAKNNEADILRRALADNLVSIVMRRLSSL